MRDIWKIKKNIKKTRMLSEFQQDLYALNFNMTEE